MKVGVFSPVIYRCGGAEWVGVNVINTLKERGHEVVVLTDEPLNQSKFLHVFNRKVLADQQLIFPLRLFSATNYRNIYTDSIRISILKSKCSIVIDTFSNAMLPGVSATYIHHPLLKRVARQRTGRVYYYPYRSYLNFKKDGLKKRLIFANSKFTAAATEAETGVHAHLLYPPVSNSLYCDESDFEKHRDNNVTAVARISYEKNLELIPYIAKATPKHISFTIVGLLDSKEALNYLTKLGRRIGVSGRMKIMTNVKRERLRSILLNSKVFLHTHVNEHFGISIAEAMASGCTPIVHNSGGPREFVPPNQRFKSVDEAAEMVERAVANWSQTEARKISNNARRFSESNFSKQFIDTFNSYFQQDM